MNTARMMHTATLPAASGTGSATFLTALCVGFATFWATCCAGTTDAVNWWIENILVILFVLVLACTHRRYRFSNLSYACFFLFLCLHTYGAKYAYADNLFGLWLQQRFHLSRNPYDRIVHTSFGVLMAYPIREVLIRRLQLGGSGLRWWLPVEVILSLAGLFELVEWAIADVLLPEHGKNYVGTQGDVWDAQKDMAVALGGALVVTALIIFVKRHAAAWLRLQAMRALPPQTARA